MSLKMYNMKILTLSTMLIVATSVSAFASCKGKHQATMSCAEGSVFDHNSKTCVKTTG